jgi:hypothetical protein
MLNSITLRAYVHDLLFVAAHLRKIASDPKARLISGDSTITWHAGLSTRVLRNYGRSNSNLKWSRQRLLLKTFSSMTTTRPASPRRTLSTTTSYEEQMVLAYVSKAYGNDQIAKAEMKLTEAALTASHANNWSSSWRRISLTNTSSRRRSIQCSSAG